MSREWPQAAKVIVFVWLYTCYLELWVCLCVCCTRPFTTSHFLTLNTCAWCCTVHHVRLFMRDYYYGVTQNIFWAMAVQYISYWGYKRCIFSVNHNETSTIWTEKNLSLLFFGSSVNRSDSKHLSWKWSHVQKTLHSWDFCLIVVFLTTVNTSDVQ